MLEFGGHPHKIGPNGSFDTAYGVDNIAANPLLADFVGAHHSGSVTQVSCSEVVSFKLDASKKVIRCIINENEEFIRQQWVVSLIQLFTRLPWQILIHKTYSLHL